MKRDSTGPGIFSNSIVNIGGQFTQGALGALGGLLTAHVLGPEAVGILGVTFILADFGRPLSSFTHVPSILQVHRGRDPNVVFATSLAIKLMLSVVFSVVILLASPFLMAQFHLPPETVLLASAVVLVGSFFEVGSARLEADNQMVRSNAILAIGSIAGLTALVTFWITGHLTIYTSIVSTIVANAAMSIGAVVVTKWPMHVSMLDARLGREMLAYGLRILATALLTQGLLQTETLLISHFLGNSQAGVYTVVFNLTLVMVTASQAMGVALVAAMSKLAGRGEDTHPAYQRGTLIAAGVGGSLALFFLVAGHAILTLYGPAFVEGYVPLILLSAFGLSAALAIPATTMLNVHGHAGTQTTISLGLLILNVPLSMFLIGKYGIVGAAAATTGVFFLGTLTGWAMVHRYTGAWPFSRAALKEAWAYPRRLIAG